MEIATIHASVIGGEVLTRHNYDRWSILMRHYLMGQGLWNVVESSQLPAENERDKWDKWIKENASVLHVIKVSCGAEIFYQIKGMDSAKDVWDKLANMLKPPVVQTDTSTAQTYGNLGTSQHETLTNAISNGRFFPVWDILKQDPNAKSARLFENGFTALHFSVYNRKETIVDYLIDSESSKEDLEKTDNFGSTALSIAARFGVGKSIAKKLVRKNSNLLTIEDKNGKIPVQLACSTIHEDMTRYLYVATPLGSLKGNRGFNILQECITRKMFDIAFDLLHHVPELASHSCSSGSIPLILTLAQTPTPFFKGSNLRFWERWIYDCIRVKAYSIKEGEHRSCGQKIQDFYQSCKRKIIDLFQFYEWLSLEIVGYPMFFRSLGVVGMMDRFFLGVFFVMPAMMMLSMPLILGILILGALRILITMLSRYFENDLYHLKLMDEYAREVIHLICHQSLSELDQNQVEQSKAAVEATFQAIENGIPDIVKEIIKANANNVLWCNTDPVDSSRNIFACAISHRQEEVARFLCEFAKEETNMVITIDKEGNNILHLVAKLAPPYQLGCISGSALQLQSELRWFKGVEEIVPRSYREHINNNSETPLEVFVREHKDLLKEAEEWVKKTAESSTVVGALIITITFAAVFTVPGGQDQSTGFPIFLHKTPVPFTVYMVSDAISLFAASSSVIMFLGILTSRFAYEDFLKSLPSRLVMGLSSLFISIATMTMAFCAALFIMLEGRLGVVIPVTLLACIPVAFFLVLQFPLLVEIYASTFSPNIFREVPSWMRLMTGVLAELWALVMP